MMGQGIAKNRVAVNRVTGHVDIGSGNLYMITASSLLDNYLNRLTHSDVFRTEYLYSQLDNHGGGTAAPSAFGRSLFMSPFDDFRLGGEIGVEHIPSSYYAFGLSAVLSLHLNMGTADELSRLRYGLQAHITFGHPTSPARATLSYALCYSRASEYDDSSLHYGEIHNGLTSRYNLRFAGGDIMKDLGVFFEHDHFDLFEGKHLWACGFCWRFHW